MKKHYREEITAGLVVLVGSALLFLLLGLVADRTPWGEKFSFRAAFDDVRGLKDGDPVFFHGVPCGRVVEIKHVKRDWSQIWPSEKKEPHVKVLLSLEIEPDVAAFLRTRSKVSVEKTITGITAVVIREGEGPPLAEGEILRGGSGLGIEEVAEEARSVGDSLKELIKELTLAVKEVREGGRIGKLLGSFENTAADLDSLVKELGDTIALVRPSLRAALQDVQTVSSALADSSPAVCEALKDLSRAAGDLSEFSREIKAFLLRNRHRLDGTVRDTALAAENISEATGEIRRQPWRLLYRPSASECSTLSILDAVREYNLATARLERAMGELAIIKEGPQEMKALAQRVLKEAKAALRRYRETQEALWAELKR